MTDSVDVDLIKRQIEKQLEEYERAIADAAAFAVDWRRRNPQPAAEAAE